MVYLVMCALGEMAAWLPLSSGFTGYATRFCDPALGFALGWTYFFKYIIITPAQLTAAALVIQYWKPKDEVNPGVFITVFLVTIVAINWFGIKFFGEFEFWLSSIKVLVICGVILLSLILALGGGPDHDRKGFRYWRDPGAFNTYIDEGDAGRFYALWSCMVSAVFAYSGTELIGVTVGEAQNPRKTIPRAIKLTFFRILFFYIISVLLLGMLVPYDSEELAFANKASNSAAASPFVVAIKLAGIEALPGILNGCICLFVFSAANSDLYIASRTIYGLASEGRAPDIFRRTNSRGLPVYGLAISVLFCLLAYMNVTDDARTIFIYFQNLVTIFGRKSQLQELIEVSTNLLSSRNLDLNPRDTHLLRPRPPGPRHPQQRHALRSTARHLGLVLLSVPLHHCCLHEELCGLHTRLLRRMGLQDFHHGLPGNPAIPHSYLWVQVLDEVRACDGSQCRLLYRQRYY
jgi:yeast amino acid transporter